MARAVVRIPPTGIACCGANELTWPPSPPLAYNHNN